MPGTIQISHKQGVKVFPVGEDEYETTPYPQQSSSSAAEQERLSVARWIRNLLVCIVFLLLIMVLVNTIVLVKLDYKTRNVEETLDMALSVLNTTNVMVSQIYASGVVINSTEALNTIATVAIPRVLIMTQIARDVLLDFSAANSSVLLTSIIENAQQFITQVNDVSILFQQSIAAHNQLTTSHIKTLDSHRQVLIDHQDTLNKYRQELTSSKDQL